MPYISWRNKKILTCSIPFIFDSHIHIQHQLIWLCFSSTAHCMQPLSIWCVQTDRLNRCFSSILTSPELKDVSLSNGGSEMGQWSRGRKEGEMTAAGLRVGLRETRHQLSQKRNVSVCAENQRQQNRQMLHFLFVRAFCFNVRLTMLSHTPHQSSSLRMTTTKTEGFWDGN